MKKSIKFVLIIVIVFCVGIFTVFADDVDTDEYLIRPDEVPNSTYIIGEYMFTRDQNDNYDGKLTVELIMLAARTIYSQDLEDMIIYYKNARGNWVDAMTGESVENTYFYVDATIYGLTVRNVNNIYLDYADDFVVVYHDYDDETLDFAIEYPWSIGNADGIAVFASDYEYGIYNLIDYNNGMFDKNDEHYTNVDELFLRFQGNDYPTIGTIKYIKLRLYKYIGDTIVFGPEMEYSDKVGQLYDAPTGYISSMDSSTNTLTIKGNFTPIGKSGFINVYKMENIYDYENFDYLGGCSFSQYSDGNFECSLSFLSRMDSLLDKGGIVLRADYNIGDYKYAYSSYSNRILYDATIPAPTISSLPDGDGNNRSGYIISPSKISKYDGVILEYKQFENDDWHYYGEYTQTQLNSIADDIYGVEVQVPDGFNVRFRAKYYYVNYGQVISGPISNELIYLSSENTFFMTELEDAESIQFNLGGGFYANCFNPIDDSVTCYLGYEINSSNVIDYGRFEIETSDGIELVRTTDNLIKNGNYYYFNLMRPSSIEDPLAEFKFHITDSTNIHFSINNIKFHSYNNDIYYHVNNISS